MRAVRRLMRPSAGAVTSRVGALPHQLAALRLDLRLFGLGRASSRRARPRAAPRHSWPPPRAGRTSCRKDSRNSSAAWRARSWPAPRRAWRSCRRSGFRDLRDRRLPAREQASFCASWASSDSCTRMASTSPFFTRSPSSTFSSSTRKPSTSGATRISSRGTSEPETVTISVKSACVALTIDTAGGGAAFSCLGAPGCVLHG